MNTIIKFILSPSCKYKILTLFVINEYISAHVQVKLALFIASHTCKKKKKKRKRRNEN